MRFHQIKFYPLIRSRLDLAARYWSLYYSFRFASATLTTSMALPRVVWTGEKICWPGSMVLPSISIMRNPDTVFSPSFRYVRDIAYSIIRAEFFDPRQSRFFTIFSYSSFPFSLFLLLCSLPPPLPFFFKSSYIPRAREQDKERAFIGRHYERDSPLSK